MPNTEQSIENTGGVPVIEQEMLVSGMTMYPTDKTLTVAEMPADAKETGEALADLAADIAGVIGATWPVGSVYITAAEELPQAIASIGTWVEIAMPLRLLDIKNGSRTYAEATEEYHASNLHMWLRTA